MIVRSQRLATVAVITIVLATGLGNSRAWGQDALKAEVRAALDGYVRAFSAHDANAIATGVVAAPSLLLGSDGVVSYGTAAEVNTRYSTTLSQLATQKYDRSVVKSATVCVMSENAAVATAQFTRYRTNGSILSEPTATYVFAKAGGQWKIVTQINHMQGRGLTCES